MTDPTPPHTIEPLYFGCVGGPGHFVHNIGLSHVYRTPLANWLNKRDGVLAPRDRNHRELAQGHAMLHVFVDAGVTVLAFWDRSVDSRPASNSMFLLPGVLDFRDAALAAARHFPTVWARFKFEVVPAVQSPPIWRIEDG